MRENVRDVIPRAHRKNIFADLVHLFNGLCFLPFWHMQRLHKRDANLWTFGAWSGLRYSDNSRALYEYVLAHHPDIKAVWMTRSEEVYNRLRNAGKPVELCTSKEGKKIQRQSGVFFCTANKYDSDVRLMNGIKFINLWHGMPLKHIGEDSLARIRSKGIWKRFKTGLRRIFLPWEFMCGPTICGAPFFSAFLQSAFHLPPKDVWDIVEPRLSRLDGHRKENLGRKLDLHFGNPLKVLYMPTFRDDKVGKFNPFVLAQGFDKEHFEQMLESQNIVFLYKGHFIDDVKTNVISQSRIQIIGDDDYEDLYGFLNDIDVLITDYSSIYFDYLCLKRPMILFPFDQKDYNTKAQEFYFDYSLMGAKRVYSWTELEQCLKAKTYYPPSEEEMNRFRPREIGNCCEELVQKVLSELKDN